MTRVAPKECTRVFADKLAREKADHRLRSNPGHRRSVDERVQYTPHVDGDEGVDSLATITWIGTLWANSLGSGQSSDVPKSDRISDPVE